MKKVTLDLTEMEAAGIQQLVMLRANDNRTAHENRVYKRLIGGVGAVIATRFRQQHMQLGAQKNG